MATIRGSASAVVDQRVAALEQLAGRGASAAPGRPARRRPGRPSCGRPGAQPHARRPRARRAPPPAPCSRRPAPRPGRARPRPARRDGAWSSAATSCSSPARTCTASAPWPASGTNSAGRAGRRSARPARAAAARRRPARSRRPRRRRACAGGCRRCRAAAPPRGRAGARASRPPRRADDVPTRAPAGSSASEPNGPQQASRASSRGGIAPITRPSGISPVRSFALCTATSISPASSARSISRVKTPRPSPICSNRQVAPAVAGRVDLDQLGIVQLRRDQPRLGERQRAAPRAHPDHRAGGAGSSPNSSLMASA